MINLDKPLLTAREAADRLGVKLDTLYAYVSRGRLQSVPVAGARARRYRRAEIDALRRAGERTAPPPPLASLLCDIRDGRPCYRGRDAIDLAQSAGLEETAELLWQCGKLPAATTLPVPGGETGAGLIERCQIALARLAAADPAALDPAPQAWACRGAAILRALCAGAAGPSAAAAPAHRGLAAGWGVDDAAADLLRRALVLAAAEAEIDAAAQVARLVAAAGASPYAVVGAALAAASGGRGPGRAAALFRDLARAGRPIVAVMADRLVRGEDLPGFGQPLYPAGDPRAAALLAALQAGFPGAALPVKTAVDAGIRLTGQRPNLDFALAAVATGLHLPADGALALHLIGGAVGWLAQAIDETGGGVASLRWQRQ